MVSRVADLKAAEQYSWRLLLTVESRLTVVAGHERKHNACTAEVGGCVNYSSRVKSPHNVYRGCFEECNQAQADARPKIQAQGRQARDWCAETSFAGCL